ncbi:tripartite tricarboxylate transporter substrate binding protein [Parapusillimonas sp. SGNA-6]|nr:tripartite tricarboxylate transporter substrate binding protein [Parapusillimonas sp. SGNA-6]
MNTSSATNRNKALKFVAAALGAAAIGLVSPTAAMAESWPAKPVSLVVPFSAGGTTDVLARALGDQLSKSLGQPVIVENKPGAGATLGADIVARAKPDGYTLLMGAVHHTIATHVYKNLSYDFKKSFEPVTIVALVPNVLVVNAANTKARTAGELVALAKASTTDLAYGSNGYGTLQHLIGQQFAMQNGIGLLHVPYKGSGPLTTDLIGGQVTMSFDTVTPVLPHIQSGKLRPLAVTTGTRSSALPDVPTLNEAGLKDFDFGTWFGVLAPAGTPRDIVEKLNVEMVRIIKSPDFAQRMSQIGAEPVGNTTAQMAQQIDNDTERFAALIKKANITVN